MKIENIIFQDLEVWKRGFLKWLWRSLDLKYPKIVWLSVILSTVYVTFVHFIYNTQQLTKKL